MEVVHLRHFKVPPTSPTGPSYSELRGESRRVSNEKEASAVGSKIDATR